jgi:hypothetical protein
VVLGYAFAMSPLSISHVRWHICFKIQAIARDRRGSPLDRVPE